ncbi:MAG: cell cycle protein [Chloroflexota bacterium]|nr:rod shape-determining protein RodA [Chloroflexota bacterium]GIK66717.1 MAG: cell cycle protein [Chloroflexota bacterium]
MTSTYRSASRTLPRTQSQATSLWRNFDYWLLGATMLLVLIGILFIRSATLGAVDTDLIGRVSSQITYTFIGLAVVFILASLDYRLLGALQPYIYGFLLFALGLVAAVGQLGAAGAQRWLDVGIPVQPSEIGKMLIIIALGQHLTKQYQKLDQFKTVIVSLIYVAVPMTFIFLQPNLGNVIAFTVIWFSMIWGAGLRITHLVIIGLVGLMMLPVVWINMQDYQKERILTFVNPEGNKDAQFNRDQALISIGSGGLLGKGYANGTQTQGRFLRVRHTDFIFSVIAEESGFVGASGVLFLIGFLVMRIARVAAMARDPLGALICYGVAGIIAFQTIVSVGMNLSILPVTGLTLPLVSSGGSSLVTLLFGIGLVESVAMRNKYSELVG